MDELRSLTACRANLLCSLLVGMALQTTLLYPLDITVIDQYCTPYHHASHKKKDKKKRVLKLHFLFLILVFKTCAHMLARSRSSTTGVSGSNIAVVHWSHLNQEKLL